MEKPSARNFGAAWNRELVHACKFIDSVLGMTMAAWGYITPLTHGDMYRGGAKGESGRFAICHVCFLVPTEWLSG